MRSSWQPPQRRRRRRRRRLVKTILPLLLLLVVVLPQQHQQQPQRPFIIVAAVVSSSSSSSRRFRRFAEAPSLTSFPPRGGYLGLPEDEHDDGDEKEEDGKNAGSSSSSAVARADAAAEKEDKVEGEDHPRKGIDSTAAAAARDNDPEHYNHDDDVDDDGDLRETESASEEDNDDDVDDDEEEEEDDDPLTSYVKENQNKRKDEVDDDDDDDEERESDDEQEDDNSASTTAPSSRSRLLRRILRHHARSTLPVIVVAIVLFRVLRPLASLLWTMAGWTTESDSETGVTRRRGWIPGGGLNTILKIVLVIVVLRYLLQQQASGHDGEHDDPSSSPVLPLMAVILSRAVGMPPLVIVLLLRFLLSATPSSAETAYVPPVEQHYSFETLNYRYRKDARALEKVSERESYARKILKAGAAMKKDKMSLSSRVELIVMALFTVGLFRGISQQQQTPRDVKVPETADTVVVLEMTQLDVRLSQLDAIRDKISYLVDEHRRRVMTRRDKLHVGEEEEPSPPSDRNHSWHETNHTGTVSEDTIEDMIMAAKNNTHTNTTTNTDTTTVHVPYDKVLPLEVVVVLESSGGSAAEYALAARQLQRLRDEPDITLTVIVDKVAASGGYMMACTASPGQLFAAPFAVLGSIGVLGQTLNFYETLQSYGVESLTFRSGRAKAPVTSTSEITREGLAVMQDMLDDVHRAFQRHVAEARPQLAARIHDVATGEIWLGHDALAEGLIDGITSSDEYLQDAMRNGKRVLKLVQIRRPKYSMFGPSVTSTGSEVSSDSFRGLVEQLRLLLLHLVRWMQVALGDTGGGTTTTTRSVQAKL